MIETVTIVPVAAPAAPALEVSGMLSPIVQEKPHAGEWTGAG
jgi:hypothetical protein